MGKINFKRVILGGLVRGVAFIIVELVVEGLVGLFGVSEGDLLLQVSNYIGTVFLLGAGVFFLMK